MGDLPVAIPDVLAGITWHRLIVRLINRRNEFARAHPLAVFQSILKHAGPSEQGQSTFVFHPHSGYFGNRIQKDRVYELAVVFPHLTCGEIGRFAEDLTAHLADTRNNFDIVDILDPERRTPDAALDSITRNPSPDADVWLDFVGRLDFDPKRGSHGWRIDAPVLFGLMASRLRSLYNADISPLERAWRGVRVTSYFWEHQRTSHAAQSTPGLKLIQGREGPILLENMPSALQRLLSVCSELHLGPETTYGRGYYRIQYEVQFLDRRIRDPEEIRRTLSQIEGKSDLGQELDREYFECDDFVARLAGDLADLKYQPAPARIGSLPKKEGGARAICTLSVRDHVLHRHLHRILQSSFDRMFEECAVGFRPGRSVNTARELISQGLSDGCRFVAESDIEAFFDEIDWTIMKEKLERALPPGEPLTRQLLDLAIRMPLEIAGNPAPRERGLLQGSPLSPLLSNLYLDAFDEKMLAKGYRMVRYVDDFVVLTATREEAEQALADARAFLAEEKLALKADKTALKPVDLGFTFLGVTFGGGLEQDFLEKLVIRKPLYIRPIYGFIGLDYDSVIVKKRSELLRRVPLRRVREIVMFGLHTVSTRLLHQCSYENIPVTFCSPSGGFMNTLAPDSKRFHDVEARHAKRYYSLTDADKVRIAANIAGAKIHNYQDWIGKKFGPEGAEAISLLNAASASLSNAKTVDEVLGLEGNAAKPVFKLVAGVAGARGFASAGREPFRKRDELNSLLDFAYFLLTARLNVLVRGKGLNPYLGILHSSKDHYESLVYDLAEPFRFRMDALVIRMINQGIVKKEDFAQKREKGGKYFLSSKATGNFIEIFERELLSARSDPHHYLANLLEAQVYQVMRWIDDEHSDELCIYRR